MFARAPASVAVTAWGSWSIATIGPKPRRAAAIDSTPVPQPASSTGPRGTSAMSSSDVRVVGCWPVPNAMPGSMTTSSIPASGATHGGRTRMRPATTGWWKSRSARFHESSSTCSSTSVTMPTDASSARMASAPGLVASGTQ